MVGRPSERAARSAPPPALRRAQIALASRKSAPFGHIFGIAVQRRLYRASLQITTRMTLRPHGHGADPTRGAVLHSPAGEVDGMPHPAHSAVPQQFSYSNLWHTA